MTTITPTQEHYLKRELIKLQLEQELAHFNDPRALRRFGFPFYAQDPKQLGGKKKSTPKSPQDTATAAQTTSNGAINDEFPLTKYFFSHFVLTIPFLSQDQQDYTEFWIKKVQIFYENFMGMSLSESLDRDELSKRRKMGLRLQKLLVMMYNSGLGTLNELSYYEHDKIEVKGDEVESKRLQKLLFPSKETLQNHLSEGVFINGINLNVSGVRVIKKANNKFLSGLNITKTHESHFEFIIKTRVDLPESENVYVSRRYTDFKDLHQKLKKKYPGKQLPKLPSKVKSMISLGSSSSAEDYEEDFDELDEEAELEEKNSMKHDEEIRRNLTSLFKDLKLESSNQDPPKTPVSQSTESFTTAPSSPSLSPSPSIKSPIKLSFIKSPKLWGSAFTEKKTKPSPSISSTTDTSSSSSNNNKSSDIENRLPREKTRVGLRAYLRELLKDAEVSHSDLLKEFLFKGKILQLTNEDQIDIKIRENLDLLLLLNQVKFQKEAYSKINAMKKDSLPLRNKLLNSDNGIVEIFNEIKTKNHIDELSPMLKNFIDWSKVEVAATIYQLFLGSDNSYELYSQIRRLHKLMPYSLMINILRFTNPMSIIKTMIDLLMASPFGGKSLLQTLFYGILSDDIRSQSKVIAELEVKIGHEEIISRLKMFVFEKPSYDLVESIRQESKDLQLDLLLTLIISPKLNDHAHVDDILVGKVFESYNEYKKLKEFEDSPEELEFINHEKLELYSDLKALFKLYVRTRDKEIMQQLWSEPELTSILREVFTMFYQPLVNLFSSSHVDVAFKRFENFMDDLVSLLDRLTHEMYTTDTSKIVEEIMKVLNKHEDGLFQFIHDVYLNDKGGLFDKLVGWINGLLNFLRHAKNDKILQKKIDFSVILDDEAIDSAGVLKEVDDVVESVKRQHAEYKKRLARQQDKSLNVIEDNWEAINNIEIFQTSDFGIHEHDIISMESDEDDEGGSMLNTEKEEESEITNPKIAAMLEGFKVQLLDILKDYDSQ